jgi:hypothetical protein
VFSINDIAWSRRTVKRKSTRTLFQPIIQSSGIQNPNRMINMIICHPRSALVRISPRLKFYSTRGF